MHEVATVVPYDVQAIAQRDSALGGHQGHGR
jgi:hypothetical protein